MDREMPQRMSMRKGAIVLKGISRFKKAAKSSKTASSQANGNSDKATVAARTKKKMPDKNGSKCPARILENIKKETLFTKNEIESLYKIYKKLVTFNRSSSKSHSKTVALTMMNPTIALEGIDRCVFREILHSTFDIITENMLMDRIFCIWDKVNCGLISLESWFIGMSLFLKSTTPKQIEYCFAVYDLNGDGFITKDEMFQLLKNCLIKFPQEEDPEESVKDLVDIVLRKIDKDKDGKISLKDYEETVAEEPLLLEAFGRCLPTEKSKVTFLTTLQT